VTRWGAARVVPAKRAACIKEYFILTCLICCLKLKCIVGGCDVGIVDGFVADAANLLMLLVSQIADGRFLASIYVHPDSLPM